MSIRQILSKIVLPNFERDLSASLSKEIQSVPGMVDSMLAGQVFRYGTAGRASSGAFQTTWARSSPVNQPVVKIHYPSEKRGLFQDRESWHHL